MNDRPLDNQSQPPATDTGQELSKLIGRLSIMQEVAQYKWNKNAPIDDPNREQKLLESVAKQAQVKGLQPQWTRHFFPLQLKRRSWHNTSSSTIGDEPSIQLFRMRLVLQRF
ncbi:MAG TPA: chorismate mutase [Acidobacteriaceae bacterium]